jgi:hypothetical protein
MEKGHRFGQLRHAGIVTGHMHEHARRSRGDHVTKDRRVMALGGSGNQNSSWIRQVFS